MKNDPNMSLHLLQPVAVVVRLHYAWVPSYQVHDYAVKYCRQIHQKSRHVHRRELNQVLDSINNYNLIN